jgi:hypothetical protein
MSMMDFYDKETAEECLEEARDAKIYCMKQMENIDKMIFLLEYYLATDEMLDPSVFGINDPGEEDDEDDE